LLQQRHRRYYALQITVERLEGRHRLRRWALLVIRKTAEKSSGRSSSASARRSDFGFALLNFRRLSQL
jgi:hypothetical protein